MVLANPFAFIESVYPRVAKAIAKQGLDEGPRNLSFHRQATHPLVDRRGPAVVPGWNSSNAEISARKLDGSYVVFGREGQLAFHGRASFEEIEALVKRLLSKR